MIVIFLQVIKQSISRSMSTVRVTIVITTFLNSSNYCTKLYFHPFQSWHFDGPTPAWTRTYYAPSERTQQGMAPFVSSQHRTIFIVVCLEVRWHACFGKEHIWMGGWYCHIHMPEFSLRNLFPLEAFLVLESAVAACCWWLSGWSCHATVTFIMLSTQLQSGMVASSPKNLSLSLFFVEMDWNTGRSMIVLEWRINTVQMVISRLICY